MRNRYIHKRALFLRHSRPTGYDPQWCDHCQRLHRKWIDTVTWTDYALGKFEIPYWHWSCPSCGEIDVRQDLQKLVREKTRKVMNRLLLEKYPPEKNEYLTLQEIEELENACARKSPQDMEFEFSEDDIDFRVLHLEKDGKKLYLKKSYDLLRENRRKNTIRMSRPPHRIKSFATGHFPLWNDPGNP